MAYRHLVLFRLHDDLTADDVDRARRTLDELGAASGATAWRVAESLDDRKGRVLVEDATFESEAAFRAFHTSEAHRRAVEAMSELSDWLTGDHEI